MRRERFRDLLRLAILLQGRRSGMRDGVGAAFGALEDVERGDGENASLETRRPGSIGRVLDGAAARFRAAAARGKRRPAWGVAKR